MYLPSENNSLRNVHLQSSFTDVFLTEELSLCQTIFQHMRDIFTDNNFHLFSAEEFTST